jgi:hypothetical protein
MRESRLPACRQGCPVDRCCRPLRPKLGHGHGGCVVWSRLVAPSGWAALLSAGPRSSPGLRKTSQEPVDAHRLTQRASRLFEKMEWGMTKGEHEGHAARCSMGQSGNARSAIRAAGKAAKYGHASCHLGQCVITTAKKNHASHYRSARSSQLRETFRDS